MAFSENILPEFTFLILTNLEVLKNPQNISIGVGQGALLLYLSLFFVSFRGFEPGAFKMVKKIMKKLKHSRRFDPMSFKVEVQDADTELQDSIL